MFTKRNLQNGDVCIYRNGCAHIAIPNINCLLGQGTYSRISEYNEQLKNINDICELDIIEVYRPQNPYQCSFLKANYIKGNLLYKEELPKEESSKEMTISEIEKELGYKIKRVGQKE